MAQIGRRIYWDKFTGSILVDTGEKIGNIRDTTEEEDFQIYTILQERDRETIGIMQLEFLQFKEEFDSCISYTINPTTEQIVFEYTPTVIEYKTEVQQIKDKITTLTASAALAVNDGIVTQGVPELKALVCQLLSNTGYYFYGVLNQESVCIRIAVSQQRIDDPMKIPIPEYNQDFVGRKWLETMWSTEKYTIPPDTTPKDDYNNLKVALDSTNEAVLGIFEILIQLHPELFM
jgi:hypothetical protein